MSYAFTLDPHPMSYELKKAAKGPPFLCCLKLLLDFRAGRYVDGGVIHFMRAS